eukprot:SAG11_NODE_384_length_9897_cov_11.158502_1_plen_58_part_10
MSEMSRYIFRIQNPGKVKKPNTKSVHTAESGRGLTIRPGAQGGRTRVLYVVAELVKNP